MKHIRSALITTIAVIVLVIMLANALRPLLPLLLGLIIFGFIAKLLLRS
jgi:hypothetical protein